MEDVVSKSPWPSRLARLEEAGWRVVPDDEYGRPGGRRMVLQERFITCHIGAETRSHGFFYNRIAQDFSTPDFEASLPSWVSVQAFHREPFDLLVDMRHNVMLDDRITRLMQDSPVGLQAFARVEPNIRPRRWIIVRPPDSSRYFWAGLMPTLMRDTEVVFCEIDEAWRLVEATPEEREACELAAEIAFGESALGHVERIAKRLESEPGLELMAVARELGMSPRSLQRRLSDEGFKFAELREQARLRRAMVLVESGAKVETIAREVGFASTSHFIQWFRRQTGQTPGERRATPKG